MTIHNIKLTDEELGIVREAMSMLNDMHTDCMLENTSASLFPSEEEPTVLTPDVAKQLRQEINEAVTELMMRQKLMRKLGIDVNDQGYTICS